MAASPRLPSSVTVGRQPSRKSCVGSSLPTLLIVTGNSASIGVLRYFTGACCGPATMPKPPASFSDEVGDHLDLPVAELPRIDVAEEDDVPLAQLSGVSGKRTDGAGELAARGADRGTSLIHQDCARQIRLRRIAFLAERRIGAGEQARDVHRRSRIISFLM